MNRVPGRRILECLNRTSLENGLTEVVKIVLKGHTDAERPAVTSAFGVQFVNRHGSSLSKKCPASTSVRRGASRHVESFSTADSCRPKRRGPGWQRQPGPQGEGSGRASLEQPSREGGLLRQIVIQRKATG